MLWEKDIKNKRDVLVAENYHSVFHLGETDEGIFLGFFYSYVYLD